MTAALDRGAPVAHVCCPFCGRWGEIDAPKVVRALMAGARPKRFRCSGCGRAAAPGRWSLLLGWRSGAPPERVFARARIARGGVLSP